MKLYLIRHGKAGMATHDKDRELTEEGIAECKEFFSWLNKRCSFDCKIILHSGLRRAEQTAQLFASKIRPKPHVESSTSLEPNADPKDWVKRLNAGDNNVVLVGHNPHLTRLISLLLIGNEEQHPIPMKKSMIVCLEKDVHCEWTLQWALSPKVFRK